MCDQLMAVHKTRREWLVGVSRLGTPIGGAERVVSVSFVVVGGQSDMLYAHVHISHNCGMLTSVRNM